jgi:nicotinamidase-related amidase
MADDEREPRRQRRREEDDGSQTALLVIDMLNSYDHDEAEELTTSVEDMVGNVRELVRRARDEDVPVVYVNDNYGDWNSSVQELAQRACEGERPDLVEPVLPPEGVSFVTKARHSIFYETPLEYLLDQLGAGRLVLTGQVTEQCIVYSALDAYVRHFQVVVPHDAVAHIHEDLADAALRMMERNMGAEIVDSADCRLSDS